MKEVTFRLPTPPLLTKAEPLRPTKAQPPVPSAEKRKLLVVCLHGFSCNAAINKFQTSRLRKHWADELRRHPLYWPHAHPQQQSAASSSSTPDLISDIDFVFLESPRELGPSDEALHEVTSLFPGPYRTWFEPHAASEYGRRRDAAVERWLLDSVRALGRVDGILAFSDGGAVASALTLKAEMGLAPKLWDFVVLVCAVDPYLDPVLHGNVGPARKKEAGGRSTRVRMRTPSVHVIGMRDHVYRERSEALWGLVHSGTKFASSPAAEVYRFDDGHKVPTSDKDLGEILGAWRRVVTSSGLYCEDSM